MADRTVKVSLVAQVNGYIAGMQQAAAASTYVGTEAERAAKRLAAQRVAFEAVGRSAVVVGAVIAAGVGVAIAKFAQFDQAMSNVQAVTQETTENMELLRDAALEAGGRTIFTATEAANAIEELGKAGLATADILSGGLEGALSLAASGQLEVGRAAEITATALKQYGLAGSEASHVSDVLSAGAGKALGSVEDLSNGLKFVGPVAASMGVSLEETTAALAMFADQGLLGEQAGTSLRGVLSSLTSPSSMAADEIQRLGINLYDSTGKFLGLENVAGKLSDAYSGLDDQTRDASLGIIFGNQQVTAARVLFDGGAASIRKYTAEVNDSGYASRVAADRLNNLSGDVEKLGGALDTALIRTGSSANEILRDMVQSVTFLVDGIGELPEPLLGAGLAVGTVTAAILLVGGTALLAVPKFAAFKAAVLESGLSMGATALKVGLLGGAIGVALVALAAYVQRAAESKARSDALADSFDKATGAVTDYSRSLVVKDLQERGAFGTAEKLGISQKELTDAVIAGGDALDAVTSKAGEYAAANGIDAKRAALDFAVAVRDSSGELETARDQYANTTAAANDNRSSTEKAADAYKDAAGEVDTLQSALDDLIATIMEANGLGQDAVSTNAAFRQALADVAEYVQKAQAGVDGYSLGIDQNTAAGAANADMLSDIAKKSQDAAKAALDAGGSAKDYEQALKDGRQAIIDTAIALGASQDAAEDLADQIYAMPTPDEITFVVNTSAAQSQLDKFFTLNSGRVIFAHVEGSLRGGFAGGGPTGDNLPTTAIAGFVHGREFVSDARTTAIPENRRALEFMHAGGVIRGYEGGGYVSPTPVYAPAPPVLPSYMQAPASKSGPFSIEGTLDLGNGLTGLVKGVLTDEVNRAVPASYGVK